MSEPMVEYLDANRADMRPARMLVYLGCELDNGFEPVYCLIVRLRVDADEGESETACRSWFSDIDFELRDISAVNCPKCIVEIEKRFRIKIIREK